MTKLGALVLISIAILRSAAYASDAARCHMPLAEKRTVALDIFSAVVGGLETPATRARFTVEVQDLGESWLVYQSLKGSPVPGGGGFEMSIDKCTAAISRSSFQQ